MNGNNIAEFSFLVGKVDTLKDVIQELEKLEKTEVKIISKFPDAIDRRKIVDVINEVVKNEIEKCKK